MPAGNDGIRRKLTAVVAADVAGNSRLMSTDEAATLRTLADYRQLMDVLIVEHGGRIANTAGDSILAEVSSVFDAVQCSILIQDKLAAASAGMSEDAACGYR